ncbi:MAG: 6-phosphogluconolactonase [Gemmatimonadaceae bacterium]|nr:6-phosphogluconolactonase [Gemmatimonadaceae bacterium]
MPDPRVHVADAAALARMLVREAATVCAHALATRGAWTIAVPGGSVLELLVPALAEAALPWDRAHLVQCDERVVPAGDPRSNWSALRALPAFAHLAGAMLHRMPVELGEDAPVVYEETLTRVAGRPPVLDIVLLGIGEDGHVASLFPGHAVARATSASVVMEHDAPKTPPQRLSLTLPVLTGASLTVLAAFGTSKRDAVRRTLDPQGDVPAAAVFRGARRALLLIDPAAAPNSAG